MLLQQHHEEAFAVLCEVHRHASSSGEALRGTRDAPWNGNVAICPAHDGRGTIPGMSTQHE